eukprot:scaffold58087_cov18-Tisochrysis_lutea.AAC.1
MPEHAAYFLLDQAINRAHECVYLQKRKQRLLDRCLCRSLRERIAQRIYDTMEPAPPTTMIIEGGWGHSDQPHDGMMQQAAPGTGEQNAMQTMQQSIVDRLKAAKDELLGVGGGQPTRTMLTILTMLTSRSMWLVHGSMWSLGTASKKTNVSMIHANAL